MLRTTKLNRIAIAVAMSIGMSAAAIAADTTSSVRGTIVGPNGQPATNTKIMLIHQPSGTVTEVITNDTGSFSASGLRVGGPYQVIIDSDTYQDMNKEGVFLQLGQTLRMNEQLAPLQDMEKITITGSQVSLTQNSGSSSVFGADAITNAPSFNRDLKDIIRANPMATSLGGTDDPLTVAGQNPRFNSISVDGVGLNDDFGLNSNGYPTQRSPISIDAIDQISIETNPFDVKFGGFTGARINAVTKSGTNEFHGGVFYEKTSDSWTGKAKNPITDKETDIEGIKSDTFGANLGGAIIEDELFFFINYEDFKKPIISNWGTDGSGKTNTTALTQDEFQQIRDYTQSAYGFDTGGFDSAPDETDKKWLAKLDWNINADHRAALTYQNVKGNQIRMGSSYQTLKPSSNWYNNSQDMEAYSLQLFSDWSSDLSTEFDIAYKNVKTGSIVESKDIGTVIIKGFANSKDQHGIQFGPDQYRHANELETKTLTLNFSGDYLLGDHKIDFGVKYEKLDIYNLFVEGSLGVFTFDTFEDYKNGDAYELYYHNAITNNPQDAAAKFTMGSVAGYIQDSWALSPEVDMTFGVRYERQFADDKPLENTKFKGRYGFSNQENLDGKDIILPRLGITWYASDDLTVRGGVGRFSGGQPNVWVSNSFSVTGVGDASVRLRNYTGADPRQVPQNVQGMLTTGDGEADAIDPNFNLPSDWRFSLGYDYQFDIPSVGDRFTWSAQALYIKKQDDLAWIDLNRKDTGEKSSDGRIIYAQVDPNHTYDIMLTNADKDGHSTILTTSLDKQWDNGFSANMSYTHQDITEGNFGSSSQAKSNFRYNHVINRNDTQLGNGSYEIEHNFKLSLGYTHEFFSGYASRFNAFFSRRSGLPYSWLMGGAYFGIPNELQNAYAIGDEPGVYGNYAPYIPTGADDTKVTYASGLDYQTFMDTYVIPAGLEGYAGGYVPKMTDNVPWVNTMDVSFSQELPGFAEGHKGIITVTVKNLLNMLNQDWGRQQHVSNNYKNLISSNYNADGVVVYAPTFKFDESKDFANSFSDTSSVWYLKVGVKYTF
ncbi:carboxypeptidase regulatory-like domain-containing protein [Paraglaciecola sp.]|uniref:TonB-dependent receptor n=1 Tax=Paraglaciecola sp. TaxID=1920173 RepID=UPI0030F3F393